MSRSWWAALGQALALVGPCAGGGSQLRAVVSGRGLAAAPVGAPGRALTTRAAGRGPGARKLDADAAVGLGPAPGTGRCSRELVAGGRTTVLAAGCRRGSRTNCVALGE